jgi:hypothetical protein
VVVIGDNWNEWPNLKLPAYEEYRDEHITVAGPMPGYMLQANYIESLLAPLDVRRPAPEILNWFAGLGIFVGFEYLLSRHRLTRAFVYFAVLMVGVVITIYLAGSLFRYYFSPVPVGILAILYSRIVYYCVKLTRNAGGLVAK